MDDCAHLRALDCTECAANRAAGILRREMARGIASLKAIGCIAPLLGTFATALGVMNAFAFYPMSAFDRGETAGGPEEALVSLIISLPVAIVACAGFHYLNHQVETFELEMRTTTLDLLNQFDRVRVGRG